MKEGLIHRFLFEGLDIRGALVQLGPCWQGMQAGRGYPEPVAALLGQMASVTALIAGQLKQPGRLTLQLRGEGPIQMLVMDCNEQLQMRGMARAHPVVLPAPAPVLLGAGQGGQLMLSLDLPTARVPYQSIVPMQGETLAAIFEHYLEQSEQQPSRLFLAASRDAAACLFLQKLPDADQCDADGWARVVSLAETVKEAELLSHDASNLLHCLFHEEMAAKGLRLYPAREVTYHCPDIREKVADTIVSLGKEEAEAIVREQGEIRVHDEICNRVYRFTADEVAALFAAAGEKPSTLQ